MLKLSFGSGSMKSTMLMSKFVSLQRGREIHLHCPQSRPTISKLPTAPRCFHHLPKTGRAPARSSSTLITGTKVASPAPQDNTSTASTVQHPRNSRRNLLMPHQATRAWARTLQSTEVAPQCAVRASIPRRRKHRPWTDQTSHNKRQHDHL